ncbi:MAG: 30S ribosomal protein S5 [DPANN group archaeon]|nr:30S ribosomal protein S5 [DPANN group archaeon]
MRHEKAKEEWIPQTELGRKVMNGELSDIQTILRNGYIIREPEIVDYLVPDISEEVMLIGGHSGKGGGIKRSVVKATTRMHKSGRKRSIHTMVVVGNKDGLIGLGYSTGENTRSAIEKATRKAKINLISIKRGCGSWECNCQGTHSIPFKTSAKVGSVEVNLLPAPKGINLVVSDEIKKILRLAGVKDVWIISRGITQTRINFIRAVFNALKNANKMKLSENIIKNNGIKEGIIHDSDN